MKRRISNPLGGLLVGCLMLLAPARLAAEEAPMAPDLARILRAGELRVAMTRDNWPPFFYQDAKRGMRGLDVDLATEVARGLGVRVRFVREAQTFDDLVAMVVDRRADIAAAYLSDTLDRAVQVRFTAHYVELKQTVLLNRVLAGQARRGPGLSELLDNAQAKIGVTRGSSAESFAESDYPRAQIVVFDTWGEITRALGRGELLAGLSDVIDAQKWQAENPEGAIAIRTVVRPDQPDTIAIAVHQQDRQLLYWLNHFLARKRQDGTLARWQNRYLETNAWLHDSP